MIAGYFVNLVPMRADLSRRPSFVALLGQARRTVHEALEHQDYPFGLMVQRLRADPDPSRTPIFQVMFIHQRAQRLGTEGLTPFALAAPGHRMDLGGLALESIALDRLTSLFDLTAHVRAVAGGQLYLAAMGVQSRGPVRPRHHRRAARALREVPGTARRRPAPAHR